MPLIGNAPIKGDTCSTGWLPAVRLGPSDWGIHLLPHLGKAWKVTSQEYETSFGSCHGPTTANQAHPVTVIG